MGYRAHQVITKTIRRGDSPETDKLIMEGLSYAFVENHFCLCSAYCPGKVEEPWDVVREHAARSEQVSENGRFSWDDDDIQEMAGEINRKFPDHEDAGEVLSELKKVQDREDGGGTYEFECY